MVVGRLDLALAHPDTLIGRMAQHCRAAGRVERAAATSSQPDTAAARSGAAPADASAAPTAVSVPVARTVGRRGNPPVGKHGAAAKPVGKHGAAAKPVGKHGAAAKPVGKHGAAAKPVAPAKNAALQGGLRGGAVGRAPTIEARGAAARAPRSGVVWLAADP